MDFTEVLLRGIDAELAEAMPEAHALWKDARPFTLDEPFARVPMDRAVAAAAERTAIPEWIAAVADHGGAGLVALLRERLRRAHQGVGEDPRRARRPSTGATSARASAKCENDGERLFACYEYLAEPFLTDDYRTSDGKHSLPVFVKDYPFEVSPLARRNDARPD